MHAVLFLQAFGTLAANSLPPAAARSPLLLQASVTRMHQQQ